VLRVRRWVTRGIAVAVLAGVCAVPLANATSASGGIPNPPVGVTATPAASSTLVTVKWAFAPSGPTPDRALVTAYVGGLSVGSVTCAAPVCTAMWVPGLTAGSVYTFGVQLGVASGYSASTMSGPVTVSSGCAQANVCVGVDATRQGGPALHRAAGMLDGSDYAIPPALVAPLDIQYWRTAVGPPICTTEYCTGYGAYDGVKRLAPNAVTTSMLSLNWFNETYMPYRECPNLTVCIADGDEAPYGGATPPWVDWSAYDSFITGVVKSVEASGRSVNYWDLVNEPPPTNPKVDKYFDADDSETLTTSGLEQWLLHTYQDVKAADPNAKVVCPSLEAYSDIPDGRPADLDLSTFLAFAASHDLDCDAFSWHEINSVPQVTDFNMQPQDIQAHVSRFRSLLAQYPMFAHAQIFVNEYGAFQPTPTSQVQTYQSMPGWTVGYIAALEAANVDEANRSCSGNGGCQNLLDGLLVTTGSSYAPSSVYWPYWFYAQMQGYVTPVTSSAEQVSGFAALDPTSNTLRILLGRHEQQNGPTTGRESVVLTVKVPWQAATATVTEQPFLNIGGPIPEPTITPSVLPIKNGLVTIDLPSIGAFDAYGFTLTPASS
jgi:hypothetical protein